MVNKLIESISEIIERKGIKQKFLAEKMGISEKQMSDIMHGRKTIDWVIIKKLCIALDVSPNELYGI